jgi:biotin synthase
MQNESKLIAECKEKVLRNQNLDQEMINKLFNVDDKLLSNLSQAANEITRTFQGSKIDVEQLANIKKNYCSEDCTFCSQSAFFDTGIDKYQLMSAEEVVRQATDAKKAGAQDFGKVCHIIEEVNEKVGISIECSLGFLTKRQAEKLKELGVIRYNHNLETSESKFPEICTTHTYQDRIDTLHTARKAGLELCTGGIIGMGETRDQREELVQAIGELNPEEVTVNLLVPFPGTPLELQTPLNLEEILRVFAVLRFLLPKSIIKISGGREVNLNDDGKELLLSGANGIISAGYLTLDGNTMQTDVKMIKEIDLEA